MISIPESLLDQIERGNVLLFIGERIGRDTEGLAPIDRLVAQLAARCGFEHPEAYSFPEVAQVYEEEWGRHALVQFVRDQLEALGDEPQQVHHLIAGLKYCTLLATTCVDRRLERAFAAAGQPLDTIVGNKDIAFEDGRNVQLYKLRGSVERVESLVLTEGNYETFFEDQASISVVLQGYLARKTVLFLGYDLADPYFKQLYRKVTAPLDDYARRAYAFGEAPTQTVARWCKRHGIEVVETRATAFLETLVKKLKERAQPALAVPLSVVELPALPLPERPYKLLDYYETDDAAIFFGRDQEKQLLTSLIHAHRLVLLYGASGTGKTSLLLAGVLPHLERADPPYATLHIRALEDPGRVIRRALQRRLPAASLPENGILVDFLDAATKVLNRPLVICLDQFEEFFSRWSPQVRQAFIAELAELYEARDVPVKIVFSLREDWLAAISEIEARLPELYRIKLRLLPLSPSQACQAIIGPVEQLGMRYDPALIERLLADLVSERTTDKDAAVMPPQLQLVCSALYERTRSEGRSSITLADYAAIGQAQGILARRIEEALQEHLGAEREVAKQILMALVTSQAGRAWAGLESIALEIGVEAAMIEHTLARLIGQRLVRRLDEGQGYELAHDILAASIASWISEEDRQLKQARELLHREVADWQQDRTILLSQGKFQRLNAVRDSLRPTAEEIAFLLRSAVQHGLDVPYWLERVSSSEAQVEILLEMLAGEAAQARFTAAMYLVGFPQDEAVTALAQAALEDAEPTVRDRAAVSLAQMKNWAGIKMLVEMAQVQESPQPMQALRALALIQDVAPDQLGQTGGALRRQVYYKLAKIRFWRSWPRIRWVTVAGTVGGALAFGLGLTLPTILHRAQIYQTQSFIAVVFFAQIFAILGLLAGAGIAFGIAVGEALFSERAKLGRIGGGALLGGLAFALVLFFPSIVGAENALSIFLVSVGSGLFGLTTGLGITLPAAVSQRRAAVLGGGFAGAALGAIIWRALGYNLFQDVSVPALLICGGLVGLIIAFSITWAEARWPAVDHTKRVMDTP
jgi:hypothetical protein